MLKLGPGRVGDLENFDSAVVPGANNLRSLLIYNSQERPYGHPVSTSSARHIINLSRMVQSLAAVRVTYWMDGCYAIN